MALILITRPTWPRLQSKNSTGNSISSNGFLQRFLITIHCLKHRSSSLVHHNVLVSLVCRKKKKKKEKVMKGSHSHRRPVALEGLPHMWESTKCQNNENSGREVAPYELYWRVKSGSHFYARMTTNVRLSYFIEGHLIHLKPAKVVFLKRDSLKDKIWP